MNKNLDEKDLTEAMQYNFVCKLCGCNVFSLLPTGHAVCKQCGVLYCFITMMKKWVITVLKTPTQNRNIKKQAKKEKKEENIIDMLTEEEINNIIDLEMEKLKKQAKNIKKR